jgi:hypothetical protein
VFAKLCLVGSGFGFGFGCACAVVGLVGSGCACAGVVARRTVVAVRLRLWLRLRR